jgi:hypothetical protein
MKSFLTLVLIVCSIFVTSGQKMPKPPKSGAIGKETLWESFQKDNYIDILMRTKRIAILPVSSAFYVKEVQADTLKKYQDILSKLSVEMQKAYFEGLVKKRLSAFLQSTTETNRILGEKGLLNLELLNKTPKNTLCFLLGVDAVVFVDITMEHLKSKLASAAMGYLSAGLAGNATDEVAIGLRMYEKSSGEFFWANRSTEKVTSSLSIEKAWALVANNSLSSLPFIVK